MSTLWGGIDAGGTRFVCAIGTSPTDLRDVITFPTTTPEETIQKAIKFFRSNGDQIEALGIGSFGPLSLDSSQSDYGHITSTPKQGWQNTDILGIFRESLRIPVALDTDVNAALLSEHRWGNAKGLDQCVYITVGTGIGGGVIANGRLMYGLIHPEIGHIRVPIDQSIDTYEGSCPYHGDCLEGLASGFAIQQRMSLKNEKELSDEMIWELEAGYIAYGLATLTYVLSPQRIIIGGGVMNQTGLLERIRDKTMMLLNNYAVSEEITKTTESYIVSPGLADKSGVLGAILMARSL